MDTPKKLLMAAVVAAFGLFAPVTAYAEDEPDGTVILTVTGSVANANRGAYDPDVDKFFGFNEIEFSNATQFDFEALEELKSVKVNADFPKGGDVWEYEGPLLSDVLDAAGATGEIVSLRALDGYAIEVPREELEALGAVLALKRNGKAFSIGGFGPTQIVFPRADRDELSEMSDDNWIWSIYHIAVQ